MKVIAYTALLYGKEYLYWAIKSVIDHVDEHHILYDASGAGSHGHKATVPCPDTRGELISEATRAAGDKLRWHDGYWAHEGLQRDSIHQYAPDADVILVVDADEIWPDHFAAFAASIDRNWNYGSDLLPKVQRYRLPMIHYWRSFHRAIMHDPAFPERIIFPNAPAGSFTYRAQRTGFGGRPTHETVINHMGYAQRPAIVEYKQHTHGHKGEWRKDDWFNNVYMANAQVNCHPVGSEYWNPESVNPADYMPSFMSEHPYFNMEVIE